VDIYVYPDLDGLTHAQNADAQCSRREEGEAPWKLGMLSPWIDKVPRLHAQASCFENYGQSFAVR
jgi:hypothetical protein